MTADVKWNEGLIARVLAQDLFHEHLCIVPNCNWTGHETDLLVVTATRRLIDVEIKCSRDDLKADRKKGKWWHDTWGTWLDGKYVKTPPTPIPFPTRVWKHYYALPATMWSDDLLEHIQPISGVLLLSARLHSRFHRHTLLKCDVRIRCIRRAKCNRQDYVLNDNQVTALARLASLRMWAALEKFDRHAVDEAITQGVVNGHVDNAGAVGNVSHPGVVGEHAVLQRKV